MKISAWSYTQSLKRNKGYGWNPIDVEDIEWEMTLETSGHEGYYFSLKGWPLPFNFFISHEEIAKLHKDSSEFLKLNPPKDKP